MGKTQRRIISGDDIPAIVERNVKGVRDIILCAPFVTRAGMGPLLHSIRANKTRVHLHVISRFDEMDWLTGVTEPAIFKELLALPGRPNNKRLLMDSGLVRADQLVLEIVRDFFRSSVYLS